MIAFLQQQPLSIEPARRPARLAPPRYRPDVLRAPLGLCCALLGFFCFMPYPALAIGNSSALQAGNVLVLVMGAGALLTSWKGRPFWLFPLLAGPLCVSALKVATTGQTGLDVCVKALVVWGLSCMTVLAAQLYARQYSLQLLTGIAAATLVHVAVGVLQLYSFRGGEFPLAGLYVNPSFLSVQDNAATIARYIRRPFGVFPEPSAMSASLAPWVVFWFALTCGIVRLRQQPARWQRVLFAAASAGGLGLIIVSRSGHAAITSAAVVAFTAIWFARARATGRTYAAVVAVCAVFLPVLLYFAAASIGDRLGGKSELGNSSWAERASSLEAGFDLVASSDASTTVFGTGVGLASPALRASHGLDAVFSVLLTYVFETGLLGALVVAWVGYFLLRVWAATRYDLTFAAVAGVWLVGVTLITSYEQLLPLWLTLGWLSVWPGACEPRGAAAGRAVTRRAAAAAPRAEAVRAAGGVAV
jgi:hypothetical protein